MSELAYGLSTQQRALARDWLFMDAAMDDCAQVRHFECARALLHKAPPIDGRSRGKLTR